MHPNRKPFNVERIRQSVEIPQESKGIVLGRLGVKVYRFDKDGKVVKGA